MLVVSYQSRELAHRCTKLEVAQKWIGSTEATALIKMIAELEAFQNAGEMIEFLEPPIDQSSRILIDFSRKHRAILKPAITPVPADKDGKLIWPQIYRLMLTEIVEL